MYVDQRTHSCFTFWIKSSRSELSPRSPACFLSQCMLPVSASDTRFLQRHPDIKHVTAYIISWGPDDSQALSTHHDFSHLTEFQTVQLNDELASVFLKGAKLRDLKVIADFEIPRQWASIAANLKTLDLRFIPLTVRVLEEITRSSPRLELLLFVLHQEWESLQGMTVFDVLRDLKNLQALPLQPHCSSDMLLKMLGQVHECEMLDNFLIASETSGIELEWVGEHGDGDWDAHGIPDLDFDAWIVRQITRITLDDIRRAG
ncbi:hypothetical protein SISSUDRAFT_75132 [Sistotremastrum suecicum HHB10207 ss-3]|uniref:F-box domain-containing protein n=1 Tax=Sistotremastrum suecicum HHB10207 ss-3 TaxID=1314776 RepID=A0A166BDK7_9AGAM|nr:hypothetical protein SISSUDRAFT_75132 [Sistotremastrum suecicum HHB10207 ss-3]